MLAVIPIRDGVVPAGGDETIAECRGRALLIGSGVGHAAAALTERINARELRLIEMGVFSPATWSQVLTPILAEETVIVTPGSPDGRDLAPRLAAALQLPFLGGAIAVSVEGTRVDPDRPSMVRVTVSRQGGQVIETHELRPAAVVTTLQPGITSIEFDPKAPPPELIELAPVKAGGADARVIEVLGPDIATMDLSEAPSIAAGGAGLDHADRFAQLGRIAVALGAAVGATRVITDRGWLEHDRQIGTTGVIVNPDLYLAFGISGAVQHTSGLGDPRHIVSVNTDPHCPMMQLADLAIVADANAVLDALEQGVADHGSTAITVGGSTHGSGGSAHG